MNVKGNIKQMSKNSRIITRHGETPNEWSEENLKSFEMGWSTDEKLLYINDDNKFLPIGGIMMSAIIRSNIKPTKETTSIPLESIIWIDTSNDMYIPKIYDKEEWHPLGAVFY